MGSKNSKAIKQIEKEDGNDLKKCQCEYRADGQHYKLLKAKGDSFQFGQRYIYFTLPKELAREHPRQVHLTYTNLPSGSLKEFTDQAEINIASMSIGRKNVINGKEYNEFSSQGERGGKFTIRYLLKGGTEAVIVYNGNG